jgi:hypothetical protein
LVFGQGSRLDKGIKVPESRSGVWVRCWGNREIVGEGYKPIFQILFFQNILIKNIRMLISLDERNQRV